MDEVNIMVNWGAVVIGFILAIVFSLIGSIAGYSDQQLGY